MSINKDEIEKYIFDPENPKQCKSYNLLFRIAKKNNKSFISSEFLQYFFGETVLNSTNIEDELWDIPKNYQTLTIYEKFDIIRKNISIKELQNNLNSIDVSRLSKYSFLDDLSYLNIDIKKVYAKTNTQRQMLGGSLFPKIETYELEKRIFLEDYYGKDVKSNLNMLIKTFIFYKDEQFFSEIIDEDEEYNQNYILFSRSSLEVLDFKIEYSSILITLEENKDDFFYNNNDNIKPIFLKRIEDVDLLLNVLEQDLKQFNNQHILEEKVIEDEIPMLDRLSIKNFFSINELILDNLQDKKEIYIVGENGDGKTLLLQAIAIGLKGTDYGAVVDLLKSEKEYRIDIVDSKEYNSLNPNMFGYGTSRNNHCNAKEDEHGFLTLFNSKTFNVTLKDAEQWLIYLEHKDSQLLLSMVKGTLKKLLGDEVETHITPDEVRFTEKAKKDVSFSQLSAGYRSVITFICDLIEKLSKNQTSVSTMKDFQGVVLIDEVELHLHPKWQYSFINELREIFPRIQFIVTTHSPSVLLGAGMDAVYYQIYKEQGIVKISEQKEVENNFLNDIQSNIFGFDVNEARIHRPNKDNQKRQKRAKEGLLSLMETIEEEQ